MKGVEEKDAVLALYRTTVRNMLASDKPGVVPNSSFKHASIIIEELVRCAKQRISAFCEKLSSEVWTPSVIDQLQEAIKNKVDIRIVLNTKPDVPPPPFLVPCIRLLVAEDSAPVEKLGHFTVVDGKSLRLEEDRTTRKALFAANLPQVARELDRIFAVLYENGKAI